MKTENTFSSVVFMYSTDIHLSSFLLKDWITYNADGVEGVRLLDMMPRSLRFEKSDEKYWIWSNNPSESSRFFFCTVSQCSTRSYCCDMFPLVNKQHLFESVKIFELKNGLNVEFINSGCLGEGARKE